MLGAPLLGAQPAQAVAGGPLVIMGIDAEDCGPGGHGPISVYESVVTSILSNVTNGGSGVLVIGGGKSAFDGPTSFWDTIGTDLGVAVTYANGAAVATQSFAGFAMIGVISDFGNTCSGLTSAENDALTARSADVAAFVNGGGGLLGFSQSSFASPYAYLGGLGAFAGNFNLGYSNITPTPAGTAIGITDALDVCCWHDEYTTFPGFLSVLATNASSGNAAALGGAGVVIGPTDDCPATEPTITGTAGNDIIAGTAGPDVIHTLAGNDIVDGRGGNDIICLGAGDDQARGGAGADQIFGGDGNDE
ncbi:MAG: calcium-binding protein, partial [Acidimicrobiales bacterium]